VRNPIIAKFLVSRKGAKDKRKGAEDFAGKERRRLMNALPTFRLILLRAFVPSWQKDFTQRRKGEEKRCKEFCREERKTFDMTPYRLFG
jgi:hypothetical protein